MRLLALDYIKARRRGPCPLEPFLAKPPRAGPGERDLLVTLSAGIAEAEVDGNNNMDTVYTLTEQELAVGLLQQIVDDAVAGPSNG